MALHIDCSTCPASPRACGDCSVGFLLGPVLSAAPTIPGSGPAAGPEKVTAPSVTDEAGLRDAIAAFANEGMLPRLRSVPDQHRHAG